MSGDSDHTARKCVHRTDRCKSGRPVLGGTQIWHPLAEAMVQDASAAPCTSRGSDFSQSLTLSTRDTILLFFDPARSWLSGWLPSWMVRVHCRKICWCSCISFLDDVGDALCDGRVANMFAQCPVPVDTTLAKALKRFTGRRGPAQMPLKES